VKTYKAIKDTIFNTPRSNRQITDMDDKVKKQIADKMLYDARHKRTQVTDKLLEIYRRTPYRTTASGNRVAWDEPEKRREDEISDRIQRLLKTKQQLQQARFAKNRLKDRNAVPQKAGKPMWEQQILEEDLNKATNLLRQYYYSTKVMRFREWCGIIENLIDALE
jgi:cell fate (sporulation/competence/biofilm development) regulator YlbF (YheA/YmcA/DUF963 family)